MASEFISDGYLKEQQFLHTQGVNFHKYGTSGYNWAYTIIGICLLENCRDVLDYGCGKGLLRNYLGRVNIPCVSYDPAIEEFKNAARPCDLVVCLDVLEHIEPDYIKPVMGHLKSLTKKLIFISVCQRPAGRRLRDGRNAHILIKDTKWWRGLFEQYGFEMRRDWPTSEKDPHLTALMKV